MNTIIKFPLAAFILLMLNGCSIMGSVAKSTFSTAKEISAAQPDSIRKKYPEFVKKTFFTSELLTTDYDDWRLRLVSNADITPLFESHTVNIQLSYELDGDLYKHDTHLVLTATNDQLTHKDNTYLYDFKFAKSGKEFWLSYQTHLFNLDKPWFTYTISPKLPQELKEHVTSVNYNYAPSWGYLSLREFMLLFDLMSNERWDDFCQASDYDFDKTPVCGEVNLTTL